MQLGGEMFWMVAVPRDDLSRARSLEELFDKEDRVRRRSDNSFGFFE
jgi:hypothetical protein